MILKMKQENDANWPLTTLRYIYMNVGESLPPSQNSSVEILNNLILYSDNDYIWLVQQTAEWTRTQRMRHLAETERKATPEVNGDRRESVADRKTGDRPRKRTPIMTLTLSCWRACPIWYDFYEGICVWDWDSERCCVLLSMSLSVCVGVFVEYLLCIQLWYVCVCLCLCVCVCMCVYTVCVCVYYNMCVLLWLTINVKIIIVNTLGG